MATKKSMNANWKNWADRKRSTKPPRELKDYEVLDQVQQQRQLQLEVEQQSSNIFIKIKDKLRNDPLAWGLMFLAEHLRDKPAYFHKETMDAAIKHNKLAVVAPRGHSKSTILSFVYPLHSIFYQKKRFIVLFSNTKEKAANFLDRIKVEIETNELLHTIYGKPEFNKSSMYDMVVTFQGQAPIRVVSRGEDGIQNIRGEIKGAYRPDLMIFDDVEYQDLVDSADRRRKLKQDFNEAALPAGDIKLCQYIAIGTILHFDALIANLVDPNQYNDWYKLFYTAVIDEHTQQVLWADRIPFKYLMQIKRDQPLVYAKEYQNNPIAGENTRFTTQMIQKWKPSSNGYELYNNNGAIISKGLWTNCVPAIGLDLAWSEKKTADETVIISTLLTPEGYLIVYDYHNERGMRPERFSNILFAKVSHLKDITNTLPQVGLEKAMLEKVQKDLLKQQMRKRNEYFILKDVKWEADKITRIEVALEVRYANKIVFHKYGMGDLEEQLLQFPYSKHDDILDALVVTCKLLKYSKSIKPGIQHDDSYDPMFEFWRQQLPSNKLNSKPKSKAQFLFGKRSHYSIASKKSFMR